MCSGELYNGLKYLCDISKQRDTLDMMMSVFVIVVNQISNDYIVRYLIYFKSISKYVQKYETEEE